MNVKGIRKSVKNVSPYVSGKTIKEVKDYYGLDEVIKLGSNENPYGPFSHAKEAMLDEVNQLFMYPDNTFEDIKGLLADKYNLKSHNFAVAHGAGGMLETLAKAFIEEDDEIIIPLQSYGLYREISKIMGGKIIDIPLDEKYTIDVEAIREAITPKTKLIWLCNPNNPTGTVVDIEGFNRLVESLDEKTWLILDEAYMEFAPKHKLPNAILKVVENKNIIIVRTFSKAYGLAGARMGYAIANPEVITLIDTVAEPFNANRIGLAGAIATLQKDQKEFDYALNAIIRDRKYLTDKFKEMDIETSDANANFVFINTPYDASELAVDFMKKGVIVRPCGGWNYPKAIRVTVGTEYENDMFLRVFREIIKEKSEEE